MFEKKYFAAAEGGKIFAGKCKYAVFMSKNGENATKIAIYKNVFHRSKTFKINQPFD